MNGFKQDKSNDQETLTVRPIDERDQAPELKSAGRGWASRLIRSTSRPGDRREPTPAQKLLGEKLAEANLGKSS